MDDEDCFIDYEKRSHLDENQLEYRLYIFNNNIINIDEFYDQLNDFINKLSLNYIWNHDKFFLNKPKLVDNLFISEGIIDYSDNIDDEWFIVYLLIELTFNFQNRIIAQVIDSDGDFMLIHLANYLPKWASNSINMKNRVFLFNGELHLIPPATNPSQITYLPSQGAINFTSEAVRIVSDFSNVTRASEILQKNLFKRIESFKNYEKHYLHQTTCTIPAKLAWVLSSKNSKFNNLLLSRAINRFCDKDPSDLKLCRTLNTFNVDNLIDYRVTFTKFLYCKLKYCEYNADKRHNWPKLNETTNSIVKDRLQLGLKLTCAFELLSKVNENDANFQSYIENLESIGYFKGNLKDSQEYSKLFEQAKLNFSTNKSNIKLNDCLENLPEDYIEQLNEEIDLIQKKHADDNDDWLHVDQAHLDDYLEMYSTGNLSSTYDFKLISDAFKKFLDLKQPKNNIQNESVSVEYKAINKDDEELIDFNVNLIENNLNELLSRKEIINDDDDSIESDSFYEINKNELSENEEDDDENRNLKEYIKAMDNELESEKELAHLKTYEDNEDSDDDDDNKMLNLDVNLVSNAIESYSSQLGLSGPVSNILKSLGI